MSRHFDSFGHFLFTIFAVIFFAGTILSAAILAPVSLFSGGHWLIGSGLTICECITAFVALVAIYSAS